MICKKPLVPALFSALILASLNATAISLPFAGVSLPENAEKHDPCEQALTPNGKANGLHKRCEAIGTGGGAAKGDFNGDGFADLAVGSPYEDRDGHNGVGAVNIIYGSADGLTATGDQFLDMADFGLSYESNSHFGWSLAAGDFNGDGFSDLAIGIPDADFPAPNNGRVVTIEGSPGGLDGQEGELTSGFGGRKGAAMVWGDFNGDGFSDLAVGSPDATIKSQIIVGGVCLEPALSVGNAGGVSVFYGSANGLREENPQRFRQGTCETGLDGDPLGGEIEDGDRFGSSLTTSRKGVYDDLVIGVPYEDIGSKQDAGAIHLLRGSNSGLGDQNQIVSQDTSGVVGGAETGDQFGRALAMADFNGDGKDDLAVGMPFEDLAENNAGAVQILFAGSGSNVVTTAGNKFISQADLAGVGVEAGDRMGWALATGDFDSDGRDDLAIGVPGESIGSLVDAGLVTILYGSSSGPSTTRIQHFTQNSAGIPGDAEGGDQFGYALSAWNFGKGPEKDLAIGVPFEDVLSAVEGTLMIDAGSVNVLYGSIHGLNGLSTKPAEIWNQDSPGIIDAAQGGDRFGSALY